jgi:hypothetical protein
MTRRRKRMPCWRTRCTTCQPPSSAR